MDTDIAPMNVPSADLVDRVKAVLSGRPNEYAVEKMKLFNDVKIIGHSNDKGAILSFVIDNIHPNDIGMILDQFNVAIRTGHHCAQPLLKKLNINATARASFGIYNTKDDVDKFIDAIKETKKFFK